ncbi:MAG: hypothetical protein NUV46_02980 [Nanoarchaeota archaeon]|nr:hypothetical protein [Nanoarchaeota archaeon]
MRKILMVLVLGVFMVSFLSASVVFDIQPNAVYNMGDKAEISIKIIPEPDFNEVVSVFLVCGSNVNEVYKEFLSITQETSKRITIPFSSSLIGPSYGGCRFDLKTGNSLTVSSQTFEISKSIEISFLDWGGTFDPGASVSVTGSALKENGKSANGVYEIELGNLSFSGDVLNGELNILFTLPENFPAGEHKINTSVFEKDGKGEILNSGYKISFLNVKQIPRSIEIILFEKEVLPGMPIGGKIILHDQTGKSILNEEVYIAIKNSEGKIIEKIISKTEEDFSYETLKNELPSSFYISVYSGEIINHEEFRVLENKEIYSEIVENLLVLTNVGNVFYNDTLVVLIGEKNVSIPLSLGIGQVEKYRLSAPDGDYEVSVNGVKNSVFLSGSAVDVKKVWENYSFSFLGVIIWLVAISILSFGAFSIFKKSQNRTVFGRARNPKVISNVNSGVRGEKIQTFSRENVVTPSKKLELSLSIIGSKQTATIGCLFLKNYENLVSGEGGVKETLSKVSNVMEENKGLIYANNSYIFFILAPQFTKTFKNEKEGVAIAGKIKEMLKDHNKKFKQKIDFGISLNSGEIIIKADKESTKFMSLGTFMVSGKKLASASNGEIFISEPFKKTLDGVKGESVEVGGLKAYKLDGLVDKSVHSTFIKGFIARQERDKSKENSK